MSKTQDQDLEIIQKDLDKRKEVKTELVPLEKYEVEEIERTFSEIRDFRTLGEKIVGPMDAVLSQSLEVIGEDPIMNVSDELSEANKKVQSVYNEILAYKQKYVEFGYGFLYKSITFFIL